MFDIAWTEMLVLAVIIVVVVGPRDLPKVMRAIGSFMRRARAMASQFQSDMDQLARESEIDELRKQARAYQQKFRHPDKELDKLVDPAAEKQQAAAAPADAESGEAATETPSDSPAPSNEQKESPPDPDKMAASGQSSGRSAPDETSQTADGSVSDGETGRG